MFVSAVATLILFYFFRELYAFSLTMPTARCERNCSRCATIQYNTEMLRPFGDNIRKVTNIGLYIDVADVRHNIQRDLDRVYNDMKMEEDFRSITWWGQYIREHYERFKRGKIRIDDITKYDKSLSLYYLADFKINNKFDTRGMVAAATEYLMTPVMIKSYSLTELLEYAAHISKDPKAIIRHFPNEIKITDDLFKPIMQEKMDNEAATAAADSPEQINEMEQVNNNEAGGEDQVDPVMEQDVPEPMQSEKEDSSEKTATQTLEEKAVEMPKEANLLEHDIRMVMREAQVSRNVAIQNLLNDFGSGRDIIDTIRDILVEKDIDTVMGQTDVTRAQAILALSMNNKDAMQAISSIIDDQEVKHIMAATNVAHDVAVETLKKHKGIAAAIAALKRED